MYLLHFSALTETLQFEQIEYTGFCFDNSMKYKFDSRTGRAGADGESFTFITHSGEDVYKTIGIVELMHKTNQWVPPEIQQMVDSQLRRQQVSFIIF